MKVGMISRTIPSFDRGGIQTHVMELSRALSNEGVEVHLFIIGKKTELDDVQIHPIKYIPFPKLTLGQYISFTLNSARHVKKFDLDIVHGHSMYSFGYSLIKELPFVVTLHGTQLNEIRSTLRSKFNLNHVVTDSCSMLMERYSAKKADKIIVDSEENRKDVINQYHVPSEKICVIHCGVDIKRFKQSSLESNTVLFVGRLHERKGVDKLLQSFSEVLRNGPTARLKIIGKGEDEKRLKRLAKKLGIEKNVEFMGFVPDSKLPDQYSTSSIFVLPSYYEGFGIVLLEAMASGLPVISVKTGGAAELIENGKNGYLVDYHNMSNAILHLLQDKELRKSMGKCSREIVEKNFSWKKIAKKTIRIYDRFV